VGRLVEGPAPRADRGVIRLLVLDAIAAEAHHGYEIIHAIGTKSGGVYRPSPGVIYPTLQLLEDLDFARGSTKDERKSTPSPPRARRSSRSTPSR